MGRKVTAADIQVEIAKGAFRPHTALSNMALSYFQSDKNYFARTIFPMCPVSLSADNYYTVYQRSETAENQNDCNPGKHSPGRSVRKEFLQSWRVGE